MTTQTPRPTHVDDPVDHRNGAWRRWLATGAAVISVLTVAAVHLYAASRAHGPVWTDDEIGILANARVIAGVGEPYDLAHLSYYPGWSVLLAPLWWVLSDPADVYRAGVLLAALCGIALVVPLAALARRLGLGTAGAVVVASVVAVAPGRAVLSTYVLTENALTLVLALTALAAVRYAERRSLGSAVLLGSLAAASFVTHGRVVAVLGMTLVWLVVDAVRGRRGAWVGAGAATVLALAGFRLHLWVSAQLYGSAGAREASALSTLDELFSVAGLRSLVGQLWYVGAAWLALPTIGVAVVVTLCVREARRRRPDLGWWALGAVVGSLVISVPGVSAAIARGSDRLDVIAYGRYLEPILVPLALVGLAWFVARGRRRLLVPVAGVTVAVVLVFQLWIVATSDRGGWWGMINIAGLLGRSWPFQGDTASPPWTVFSVTAVVAVLLYLGAVRWRRARWLVVAVLAAYLTVSSLSALTRIVMPQNAELGAAPDLAAVVRDLDPDELSYDTRGADWVGQNLFQFWLTGIRVHPFDSRYEAAPTELVISRSSWGRGERDGARRIAGSQRDEALWVLPGPLADAYDERGFLEPEDPAQPLEDFGAEVRLADPADVPVDGGTVDLEVTNEGEQVWAALGTTDDAAGVVRLVIWWHTGSGPVSQIVELPHSVIPGATADVEAALDPPEDVDLSVPADVTLVQEGVGEFTPPGEPALRLPVAAG
ncbi:hypothetical protein [Cellulomonas sp. Y8]|uniref:hypothetical protein n=1 Tax=Cellulomonas sp. Y8 TaxID=2591145 RepID=UPI003D752EE7